MILTLLLAGTAFTAGRALDYMEVVDTYWRVHDDVFQPTEMGRYYIDLFWQHNYELCTLIVDDAQVKRRWPGHNPRIRTWVCVPSSMGMGMTYASRPR